MQLLPDELEKFFQYVSTVGTVQEDVEDEDRDSNNVARSLLIVGTESIVEYMNMKQPEYPILCVPQDDRVIWEILQGINNELLKAKMLIYLDWEFAIPLLEDQYVQDQVRDSYSFRKSAIDACADAENKIKNFFSIKEQFLRLPEEERADFLIGLPAGGGREEQENRNAIRRSLLARIESPEERQKVEHAMNEVRHVQETSEAAKIGKIVEDTGVSFGDAKGAGVALETDLKTSFNHNEDLAQ